MVAVELAEQVGPRLDLGQPPGGVRRGLFLQFLALGGGQIVQLRRVNCSINAASR